MTIEEATSEIVELKKGNESLVSKNSEILNELKQERKSKRDNDENSNKYYEMKDKYDDLSELHKKMEHDLKTRDKEVLTLSESNSGLNSNLHSLIVDGGLSDNLSKIGVLPHFMDGAKALLRGQVSIVENKAVVGDKPLSDFMQEWAGNDGKHYIPAQDNSGGGANGNRGNASGHMDTSKMTPSQKMNQPRKVVQK